MGRPPAGDGGQPGKAGPDRAEALTLRVTVPPGRVVRVVAALRAAGAGPVTLE